MNTQSKKAEIILFRHGETDWNREERFQGHIDIPLNGTGREQARALVSILHETAIEAILSSDLCRAVETAVIIAEGLQGNGRPISVFTDAGLREAHLGEAQGLTRAEIETRFGSELVTQWRSGHLTDADVAYPGGESGNHVARRSFEAVERFLLTTPFHRVGVATHGGVIRRMMQRLLPPGSPPVPIPNGVVYRLTFELATSQWEISRPIL